MRAQLPTFTSAEWTVTSFRDSVCKEIGADKRCSALKVFAYAITMPGWQELRPSILKWQQRRTRRSVQVYVGTDHALTSSEALKAMKADGLEVRLMCAYEGVFHPKVIWLSGDEFELVWVGSNNLTRDGLLHNVEFATLLRSRSPSASLQAWFNAVRLGSVPLTDALVDNYEAERRAFAAKRASTGTFTWSQREQASPRTARAATTSRSGNKRRRPEAAPGNHLRLPARRNLIIEIMPKETGANGAQVQLPMAAASEFFELPAQPRATIQLSLVPAGTDRSRSLTMTRFPNKTARLSIHELDYRDRPCVLVFRRLRGSAYTFEIVPRSIFPARYRALLQRCTRQTRKGSRRWTILNRDTEA